ncbi:AgmX/PglI C-terminal domain-containing protein [Litoribrevibacter albus]|uniref:AgmX/PglI C-terminal domain-containing protein n=1 Tax=Litoribrevibacter albus TaxID=1473156 RepID=A0AA37W671_9GAMM|nr:AgmX/PglI C-terminal domain-containing protein [Litoribrevibacter albus]GLQ31360.1 hypothetical protein GCM10007876_18390 [Litoribrevibacter albus]
MHLGKIAIHLMFVASVGLSSCAKIPANSNVQGGQKRLNAEAQNHHVKSIEDRIRKALNKNKSQIFALYARELRSTPDLRGSIVISMTIEPSGVAKTCKVVNSDLANTRLEKQISEKLCSLDFEKAETDENVEFLLPISFGK